MYVCIEYFCCEKRQLSIRIIYIARRSFLLKIQIRSAFLLLSVTSKTYTETRGYSRKRAHTHTHTHTHTQTHTHTPIYIYIYILT